jgi:hypothetical protein
MGNKFDALILKSRRPPGKIIRGCILTMILMDPARGSGCGPYRQRRDADLPLRG